MHTQSSAIVQKACLMHTQRSIVYTHRGMTGSQFHLLVQECVHKTLLLRLFFFSLMQAAEANLSAEATKGTSNPATKGMIDAGKAIFYLLKMYTPLVGLNQCWTLT